MACCDECGCFDDNWVDGEDITEEELEKDPLYEPHRSIIIGTETYKKIIKCPKVMSVYANDVLRLLKCR